MPETLGAHSCVTFDLRFSALPLMASTCSSSDAVPAKVGGLPRIYLSLPPPALSQGGSNRTSNWESFPQSRPIPEIMGITAGEIGLCYKWHLKPETEAEGFTGCCRPAMHSSAFLGTYSCLSLLPVLPGRTAVTVRFGEHSGGPVLLAGHPVPRGHKLHSK